MLIVIDYDETFTADKALWGLFIRQAQSSNHTIVCCTMRNGPDENILNEDVFADMGGLEVPIIYAAEYKDKWEAVQEAGYIPDDAIWIDDRPMYVWMNRDFEELD